MQKIFQCITKRRCKRNSKQSSWATFVLDASICKRQCKLKLTLELTAHKKRNINLLYCFFKEMERIQEFYSLIIIILNIFNASLSLNLDVWYIATLHRSLCSTYTKDASTSVMFRDIFFHKRGRLMKITNVYHYLLDSGEILQCVRNIIYVLHVLAEGIQEPKRLFIQMYPNMSKVIPSPFIPPLSSGRSR